MCFMILSDASSTNAVVRRPRGRSPYVYVRLGLDLSPLRPCKQQCNELGVGRPAVCLEAQPALRAPITIHPQSRDVVAPASLYRCDGIRAVVNVPEARRRSQSATHRVCGAWALLGIGGRAGAVRGRRTWTGSAGSLGGPRKLFSAPGTFCR
jgi:hypothetical protein